MPDKDPFDINSIYGLTEPDEDIEEDFLSEETPLSTNAEIGSIGDLGGIVPEIPRPSVGIPRISMERPRISQVQPITAQAQPVVPYNRIVQPNIPETVSFPEQEISRVEREGADEINRRYGISSAPMYGETRETQKSNFPMVSMLDRPIVLTEEVKPEKPGIIKETLKGIPSGIIQMGEIAGGLTALGGEMLGSDKLREIGTRIYQKSREIREPFQAVIPSYKDITGVGDAIRYLGHGFAEMLPFMVGTMGVGGLISSAIKKGLGTKIALKAAESIADKVVKKAVIENIALKAGLADLGGLFGASTIAETGIISGERVERGMRALAPELLWAIPAGLMDALPQWRLAAKMELFGRNIARIASKDGSDIAKRTFLREFATQGFLEGSTEGAQEIMEAMGTGDKPFTRDTLTQAINAFIIAGFTGGIIGAATNVWTPQKRGEMKPTPATQLPVAGEPIVPVDIEGILGQYAPDLLKEIQEEYPAQAGKYPQPLMETVTIEEGLRNILDNPLMKAPVGLNANIEGDHIIVTDKIGNKIESIFDPNAKDPDQPWLPIKWTDTKGKETSIPEGPLPNVITNTIKDQWIQKPLPLGEKRPATDTGLVELRHYTNVELPSGMPTKPDANGLIWFTEGQSYLEGKPQESGKWGYVSINIPSNKILRIDETPGLLEEYISSIFGKEGRSKASEIAFAESKGYLAIKRGEDIAMRPQSVLRYKQKRPAPVTTTPATTPPAEVPIIGAGPINLLKTEVKVEIKEDIGSSPIPDWAREEMIKRGLDPGRTFNDVDLRNPSVIEAIRGDPTLTLEQKGQLLKTGSINLLKPELLKPEQLLTNVEELARLPEKVSSLVGEQAAPPRVETVTAPPKKTRPALKEKTKAEALGLVFYKDQQRYFTKINPIIRGKNKGKFHITLTNGQLIIADATDIVRQVPPIPAPTGMTRAYIIAPPGESVTIRYGETHEIAEGRMRVGAMPYLHEAGYVDPATNTFYTDQLAAAREAGADVTGVSVDEIEKATPETIGNILNKGRYSARAGQSLASMWYLMSERIIRDKMSGPMLGNQIMNMLVNSGVKKEELGSLGLNLEELLKQPRKFTKQEVLDYIRQNEVKVEEVTKGGLGSRYDVTVGAEGVKVAEDTMTKFSQWQLPGGENYREIVFISPALVNDGYRSPHFPDIAGYNGHLRFDDRVGPEGEKILFIEENQNDRHQAGRGKGYKSSLTVEDQRKLDQMKDQMDDLYSQARKLTEQSNIDVANGKLPRRELREQADDLATQAQDIDRKMREMRGPEEGVPLAPFSKTWHELAMKRMVRWAAENGYDKIAWTTGEQQAARYDLSKQIDGITYVQDKGTGQFQITPMKDGRDVFTKYATPDKLGDLVGKEIAQRIREGAGLEIDNQYERSGIIKGLDLKVGGEGMKGFYDKILPEYMNKFGKKWGAKVEDAKINVTDNHGLRIEQHDETFTVENRNGRVLGEGFITEADAQAYLEEEVLRINRGKIKTKSIDVHSLDITPSMRESVMQGQPLFRRLKTGEKGMLVADVQQAVDDIQLNIPRDVVTISVYQSFDTVPPKVITDTNGKFRATDKALFDRTANTVYLLADNHINAEDVQKSLFHELTGHLGIEKLLSPERFKSFVDEVHTLYGDQGLADIYSAYSLYPESANDRYTAAMEKIAQISEDGSNPTLWNKFITYVKDLLSEVFGNWTLGLTEDDIRVYLWRSRQLIESEKFATQMRNYNSLVKLTRNNMYRTDLSGGYPTRAGILGTEQLDSNATQLFIKMHGQETYDTGEIGTTLERIEQQAEAYDEAFIKKHPEIKGHSITVYHDPINSEDWAVIDNETNKVVAIFNQDLLKRNIASLTRFSMRAASSPSNESAAANWTGFMNWFQAHKERDKHFAEPLLKDLGVLEATASLPHWVAMNHPEFQPTVQAQWDRSDKRNVDIIYLLKNPFTNEGNNPYVDLKDTIPLDKVITWSDQNDTYLNSDEDFLGKFRELNLRDPSQDEIQGYRSWKAFYDRSIDYWISKMKQYVVGLHSNQPWFTQFKDSFDKNTDPNEIVLGDELQQKELRKAISQTQKRFQQIAETEEQLRTMNFYAPHIRGKGEYVVDVMDDSNIEKPTKVWSERFDTATKAEIGRQRLVSEYENLRVEKRHEPGVSEFTFGGLDLAALDAFVAKSLERVQKKTGLGETEADTILSSIHAAVSEEVMARGFRQRHMHRHRGNVIGGYKTEDLKSVMRDYATGLAGSMTKLEATSAFYNALKNIDPIKQQGLYEYASRYMRDMLRNPESIDRKINALKTIPYAWYLTANMRMAVTQFYQNFITAGPILNRLAKESGIKAHGWQRIVEAMTNLGRNNLTDEQRQMLKEKYEQGETMANYINEIKGRIEGNWAKKYFMKIIDVASIPFAGMERFNRRSSLLAAFAMYREAGKSYAEASSLASEFVRHAHYAYGLSNFPQLLREGTAFSKVAGMAYVFKSFPHNYILSMIHFMRNKEGKIALDVMFRSMAAMVVFGGLTAVPFLDDILDEWERLTGNPVRSKMRTSLKGMGGDLLSDTGMEGLAALIGIDMSGSVKVNLPVPGLGTFDPTTVFGVWAGLIDKGKRTIDYVANGEIARAIEAGAPVGIEMMMKAERLSREGLRTGAGRSILDEKGKPIKLTATETALQLGAFRPQRIAEIQKERRTASNIKERFSKERDNIRKRLRKAITEEDRVKLRKEIQTYNMSVMRFKGLIPRIDISSIRQSYKPAEDYMEYKARGNF